MVEPIVCPPSQRCQLQVTSADDVKPVESSDFRQSLASQLSILQSVLVGAYEREVSLLQEENKMLWQRLHVDRNGTGIASTMPIDSELDAGNRFRIEEDVTTSTAGPTLSIAGPTSSTTSLSTSINQEDPAFQQSPMKKPSSPQAPMMEQAFPRAPMRTQTTPRKQTSHHIRLGHIHDTGAAGAMQIADQMQEVLHDAAPGLEDEHAHHSHGHQSQSHHGHAKREHANEEGSADVSPNSKNQHHISKERLPGRPTAMWNRGSTDKNYQSEDEPSSFIQRLVVNKWFEFASACVILANTVTMAMQLQYNSFDIAFTIGLRTRKAVDTWPHAEEVFQAINVAFNVVFCIELLLRIAASRWRAIYSGWIWFDATIIAIGAVDTFGRAALPVNPGMLRVLRLIRLVRLFKILRAMSSFDSLFLLLKAIRSSFSAAVWAFVILGIMQLVMGLFLCQVLQMFLRDEAQDEKARAILYPYFGSFSKTILTMFEILMANWAAPVRNLAEEMSEWFIIFFLAYRCFFCFAILKVIAAVFITETNRVLEHDDEITIMKRARDKIDFDKKVLNVVQAVDSFDGEVLTWQVLEEICNDDDVTVLLSPLGFEPKDLEKLFWLLDDGTGQVPVKIFLKKLNRIKGQAKAIDILTMLKLTHRINEHVTEMCVQHGILDSTKIEAMEEAKCVAV